MFDGETRSEAVPHHPDKAAALPLQVAPFWQIPIILGCAWCNLAIELWGPQDMAKRHARADTRHHQLVVPCPIEAGGERSLIA